MPTEVKKQNRVKSLIRHQVRRMQNKRRTQLILLKCRKLCQSCNKPHQFNHSSATNHHICQLCRTSRKAWMTWNSIIRPQFSHIIFNTQLSYNILARRNIQTTYIHNIWVSRIQMECRNHNHMLGNNMHPPQIMARIHNLKVLITNLKCMIKRNLIRSNLIKKTTHSVTFNDNHWSSYKTKSNKTTGLSGLRRLFWELNWTTSKEVDTNIFKSFGSN